MPRKPGRPQLVQLDEYKDEIVKLYREDGLQVRDIAQQISAKSGIQVSTRTLIRRLSGWSVPNKRVRMEAPEDLIERIRYHYNKNLTDKQIEEALAQEGFEIPRNLPRLRQRLGMRRRSRFDQFRDYAPGEDPVLQKPIRIYRKVYGPLPPPKGIESSPPEPVVEDTPMGDEDDESNQEVTQEAERVRKEASTREIAGDQGENGQAHSDSDDDGGPVYYSAGSRSPSAPASRSVSGSVLSLIHI